MEPAFLIRGCKIAVVFMPLRRTNGISHILGDSCDRPLFLSSQYSIDSLSFVDLVIKFFAKLQIFMVAVSVGFPS